MNNISPTVPEDDKKKEKQIRFSNEVCISKDLGYYSISLLLASQDQFKL